MNKKRLIITSVISITLVAILMISSTYSIFTSTDIDENANVYTTGNLNVTYTLSEDNIVLSSINPINADQSCEVTPYQITITNDGNVPYMFNVVLNDTTAGDIIDYQYIGTQVGKFEVKSLDDCEDLIVKENVIVPANRSVTVDVRVWLLDTVQNTEIGKSFYAKLSIDGIAVYNDDENIDNSNLVADICANAPNLDAGNLIPVYYDDIDEVWKKADRSNADNSWYDYNNKMWANAILISDYDTRSLYQSAKVDTIINDSDITAFYVWIPRYKYRVWNINRQSGDETTYAYSAYTYGVDIEWESGTQSTGNVDCAYDTSIGESSVNLSDTCIYNDTTIIMPMSLNTDFIDAWYTHPAFTFGDEEKTGFWVGKFETTGSADIPTILPDSISLTEQNLSSQFTTSKVFQTYGLSKNIDAHMLTNLEWGAVSYLTHSIYGLCDGKNSCRDVYINNSSDFYTGRSGGALSGSENLLLKNVYSGEFVVGEYNYNTTGYYTYNGYFIDYNGDITLVKDTSKIASTTGNITGVYDLSGGANEYVMGNMVDSSNNFYPGFSGTIWNESTSLDNKYYDAYSYGTNDYGTIAYNRARLGDATAEVISSNDSIRSAWKPGNAITSTYSGFIKSSDLARTWFVRGGIYSDLEAGAFSFYYGTGNGNSQYSFRSSLS